MTETGIFVISYIFHHVVLGFNIFKKLTNIFLLNRNLKSLSI